MKGVFSYDETLYRKQNKKAYPLISSSGGFAPQNPIERKINNEQKQNFGDIESFS